MRDTPFPGDCTRAFNRCEAITRDLPLMVGQLGLPAHVHTPLAGSGPALVCPLYNPMPLVLCHGRQERDEAPAEVPTAKWSELRYGLRGQLEDHDGEASQA